MAIRRAIIWVERHIVRRRIGGLSAIVASEGIGDGKKSKTPAYFDWFEYSPEE